LMVGALSAVFFAIRCRSATGRIASAACQADRAVAVRRRGSARRGGGSAGRPPPRCRRAAPQPVV
jgi:hypothetical protein